jgi:hypothetical protein
MVRRLPPNLPHGAAIRDKPDPSDRIAFEVGRIGAAPRSTFAREMCLQVVLDQSLRHR